MLDSVKVFKPANILMQLMLLWQIPKYLWRSWSTGNIIILISNLVLEKGAMIGKVTFSKSRGKSDGLENALISLGFEDTSEK